MKLKKINVPKLKDEINLFLYEKWNWGIDKLKVSNEIIEKLGGYINEKIDYINSIIVN